MSKTCGGCWVGLLLMVGLVGYQGETTTNGRAIYMHTQFKYSIPIYIPKRWPTKAIWIKFF